MAHFYCRFLPFEVTRHNLKRAPMPNALRRELKLISARLKAMEAALVLLIKATTQFPVVILSFRAY